jgi:hypothetical protein
MTIGTSLRVFASKLHVRSRLRAPRTTRRAAPVGLAVIGLVALHPCGWNSVAVAQTPTAQPPVAQVPAAEPAAPANQPVPLQPAAPQGFIGTFGNWMQQGVSNMGAGLGAMVGVVGDQAGHAAKGAADAASTVAKGAADVARDTASSVTKLPATGVIRGRERCALAPNGAPDCRIAADALCRAKGYNGGTSVDFETAEKCPPPYRVSSRNTPEGVCTFEHFVTSALCQ